MKIIETDRLILRTWKNQDAQEYFRINQDPKVIEFLPGSLTLEQSQNFITAQNQQFDKKGFSLWATEEKSSAKLIGFIGLSLINWEASFTPCVEIGWRLDSKYWRNGFATEGAKAVLRYGFDNCDLEEIVAITVPANKRSIRVMEKIGMQRDFNGDFFHPKLPRNHRLSKHILYRIKK